MKSRLSAKLILLLFLTTLVACGEKDVSLETVDANAKDSVILAEVSGSAITREELDFALQRTFSKRFNGKDNDEVRNKVLKSLVSSRAMALLMEKDLSLPDKHNLELKVRAYREELLVQRYLTSHVTPKPVSTVMVKEYYEKHPEEFGGEHEKEVEIIKTVGELDSSKRKEVLTALGGVGSEVNWDAWVQEHVSLGLSYKKVRVNPDVLQQPLKTLITATGLGAVSPVHNDKDIIIVRVLSEERLPAKPLAQVSADIRRKLAPTKLRESVKEASDMALKKVEVKYFKNNSEL